MLYILIIIIGGIASFFGPWWVVAPVCFALCWWKAKTAKSAFGVSALAAVTLWVGYSLYLNTVSEVNMSDKIAGIFTGGAASLESIPKIGIIITIVTLVSGLSGGFAGMAGVQVRNFFKA
jgi:hypothetical protein